MKEMNIALYGQFDNDTKFVFTYPNDFNPALATAKDAWLKSIRDPRDAREFKAERIYAIWKDNEGNNYYGLIVPNKQDYRNGYILLAVFIGKQLPISGHIIIDILNSLEKILIVDGIRDKQLVSRYVETVSNDFVADFSTPDIVQKSQSKAFRLYEDESELAELLLYPNQPEYASFYRVLFVPKHSAPHITPANYMELHNVIRHSYVVKCPEGAFANKQMVSDGSFIEITYNKTGYSPLKYEVKVTGAISQFYSISGNTLNIKRAEEAGVSFSRSFRLNVFSEKTKQPLKTIIIDGRAMPNGSNIKYHEQNELAFRLEAYGYEARDIRIGTEEIEKNNFNLSIGLKVKEETLKVIAVCDGNKKVEGNIKMASDDKLYPYFYDKHQYEIRLIKRGDKGDSGSGNNPSSNGSLLKKLLLAAVGAFIGFALASYLAYNKYGNLEKDESAGGYSCEQNNSNKEDNEYDIQQTSYDNINNNSSDLDNQDILERHDLGYLKERDIWVKDSIQSDKYKSFFNDIVIGDVEGLLNHDYSRQTGDDYLNGYWKAIVMELRKMEDRDNTQLATSKNELKRLSRNDSCDVKKLSTAIHMIVTPQSPKQADKKIPESGNSGDHSGRPNSDR